MSQKTLRLLLRVLSYVLVAALACGITLLAMGGGSKLYRLEQVIGARFVGDYDETAMEDAAARSMISALGDRWSYYIPAASYQEHKEGKNNAYVGIGVTVLALEDGSGIEVVSVTPGGSAIDAGILPGDIIVAVDGKDIAGMTLDDVTPLIGGKEGATVSLSVRRGEETLEFSMKRQKIRVKVAEGQLLDGHIGYIKINNFNTRCADETIACIEDLMAQGADQLVFDVRYNPGGYVTELVKLLDYLLPEGDLFRSESSMGIKSVDKSDADCLELPMAVLVNGDSYSAAEFFAAALEEYDWAVVVGEPTVGKGYFQNTIDLGDGSAVALSVGRYYTPNGVCLADVGGLVPSVSVALDAETAVLVRSGLVAPMEDPQILAAIEALKE